MTDDNGDSTTMLSTVVETNDISVVEPLADPDAKAKKGAKTHIIWNFEEQGGLGEVYEERGIDGQHVILRKDKPVQIGKTVSEEYAAALVEAGKAVYCNADGDIAKTQK